MKPIIVSATCALAAATPTVAQDVDPDPFAIPNPNRFSLGARVSLNFKATFQSASRSMPGPDNMMGGIDRTYDDGYVRVDSSGNELGHTWNWGYEDAAQVVLGKGGPQAIDFHQIDSPIISAPIEKSSDEAYYGMELVYQRLAATFGSGGGWGFEGAFSYSDFELRDRRSASGPGTLLTDQFTFPAGVQVVPQAPYHGSFAGPGTLLNDAPTRTTTSTTVTLDSNHRVSGQLLGFRFGPFVEWNFSRAFSVALSGGIALAPALIDYEFAERVEATGFATDVSMKSSKTDLLYGHYISAVVRYHFNERWGVYGGAQFQTLSDFEHTVDNPATNSRHTARIEAESTVHGVLGVTWKF